MFGIGSTELVILGIIVLIMVAGAIGIVGFVLAISGAKSRKASGASADIRVELARIEGRIDAIEARLRRENKISG